jgi:hypothetical protein
VKLSSLATPILTFLLGGLAVFLLQPRRESPPRPAAALPKPVAPPPPAALAQPTLIVPDPALQTRIAELERDLANIAAQRDEALAILRVTPSAKADPTGEIFRGLLDAAGKPVATYDTANRVFHYNPADSVLLPADGKILLNRAAEIAADLKSTVSEQVATLSFENETTEDVYLFWIDYQGRPIPYDRISPGERSVRPTYMTHPWVITDANGNRLGDVKPELPAQTEVIPISPR